MQRSKRNTGATSGRGEQWAGQAAIVVEPTAETAPLSLASVKMSSMLEASVELLSHETRAIHGVIAGDGCDEKGGSSHWAGS